MSKGVAVVATVAAVAAGGVAYRAKTLGERHYDEQRGVVASCEKSLAECATDRASGQKAATEAAASLDASRQELDELRAEHAAAEKRLAAFKALTEQFRKMIDSGKLEILLRHGRMVVKLPAGVLFASGSADLSKEGKDALRDVAAILRKVTDRRFMVAGHTDNMPLMPPAAGGPAPFKNNLELSTARALTVAQQLVASGMPPSRLIAAGYSEYEPVRSNATEAGRQENRRIEIVLMPNLTEIPELPGADAGAPLDAGKPDASHP
ncbi:MAG TPA: OmpA family protein [Labilithrix sp.]|jgi:chemotaxis protein MotB|nr:OmpA family protein [Labilithrix sp.]